MMEVACRCDGLPSHDHRIRNKTFAEMTDEERWRYSEGGEVYEPTRFDPDDIGRIWVDWKEVARALTTNGDDT